jgi:Carboxypeptidase regulatory-like domain/TonB-dependent Receptor Plug Domain
MISKCLLSFLAAASVFAQSYTGSISGRVTDGTGLPVPKVQIAVTEESTNTTIKTESNETGDYTVSYLKPGSYKATFTSAGFKEHLESGIQLQIDQQRRVDPKLEVGQVNEVIEVAAAGAQVNLVSSEIGHVVDSQQLVELPELATSSRGRSPFLLAKIVPGVTTNGNSYTNINGFSLAGGRRETNEILVDGLPTTNPSDETYTLTPSPDSIDEFKVITTPFSAEYGHTGGGVMIATTRSGTNTLHGSAYDLFRNRVLNGRDFFSPIAGQTKYVQNDPGGTIGGPALVPKVYDGRNKTFFFVDFNVTLATTATAAGYSALVPTDPQKAGDFSQTIAGGKQVPIYDPKTISADGKTRLQFPGNVIPANRIDPVAAQIVKFYPEPNANINGNNYFVTTPNTNDNWQYLGRLDQNFGSNDRAFFRFGQYSPNSSATPYIPNKANNSTAGGWVDTQSALSETHIFSATIVNDFRFGWVQEDNYTTAGGSAAPELGLSGVSLSQFPIIGVSQLVQLGSKASNHDRDRSWVFSNGLTWQRDRHTIKIGGDFRRQMYDTYNPGKLSGTFSFTGAYTGITPNATGSGYGLADLLLGAPTSTTLNITDYTYRYNINSAGAFIQDDYKVTNRLTVNLGLRWEWDGPYSEANNQFYSFNPNIVDPAAGKLGTAQFAGQNGAPTHFSPNIFHNFLPRIGFAWNFLPDTVFRGGFGIYRLPAIGFSSAGQISKYSQTLSAVSTDNNQNPPYYLANGVPPALYNVDANGNPNIRASLTNPSSNVTELEPRARTPYNETWQFGIQRKFKGNWLLEADYVGTKGVKLPIAVPLNQLPANEWGPGNLQSLRPYPQYLTITALTNNGNSFYNALQSSVSRRWQNGVLTFAYTWSKVTDDVDGPVGSSPIQNIYNVQAEHGIASYSVPQRFVASYVYRLPIGAHGQYLNNVPVVNQIIGGWELSGITEFQVGLPIAITQNNATGGFTGTQRPNQIAPAALPRNQRTLSEWFNTNAFTVAPAYTSGNAPRFPLYGPGINNWDVSLMRNVMLGERLRMQFRAEFYNAMNHPNFSNPNTTIGNANYGKITSDVGPRTTELALRFFW